MFEPINIVKQGWKKVQKAICNLEAVNVSTKFRTAVKRKMCKYLTFKVLGNLNLISSFPSRSP